MTATFVVLVYVNRSGSTFLSRQLGDSLEGLYVFPEMAFPLDILRQESRSGPLDDGQLRHILTTDRRIDAHGLDGDALNALCRDYRDGGLRGVLTAIATQRLGYAPQIIMIKLESYLDNLDALARALGPIKIIHIVRDVRGVASSMLKTSVPEKPGFNMARNDVVYVARHWSRYLRRVRLLAPGAFWIRYEDLLADPRIAVERVGDFLKLNVRHQRRANSAYALAGLDLTLHPKIFDAPDVSRINGWRDELAESKRSVITRLCSGELSRQGYDPAASGMSRSQHFSLWRACILHAWFQISHYMMTGVQISRRPGGFSTLLHRLAAKMASGTGLGQRGAAPAQRLKGRPG